jgi:hypothetical protein
MHLWLAFLGGDQKLLPTSVASHKPEMIFPKLRLALPLHGNRNARGLLRFRVADGTVNASRLQPVAAGHVSGIPAGSRHQPMRDPK